MYQGENTKQLLRLLNSVRGTRTTLKQVTDEWIIDPDASLHHDTEQGGKVASGNTISINDYYPLVQYPLGDKYDRRAKAKAR